MTDLHTKVFQSQRLTPDFVYKHGFNLNSIVCEIDFHYIEYTNTDYPELSVFFNYYNNGVETYELLIKKEIELQNVDKSRFLTLLQMLKPKEDA